MDLLYDFVIHVLAHKPIPGFNFKLDTIIHKVVLVAPPDDIVEEEYVEEIEKQVDGGTKIDTILHKQNAKHSSVLFIKVGQYELEEEIRIEVTSNKDKKGNEAA